MKGRGKEGVMDVEMGGRSKEREEGLNEGRSKWLNE